MSIFYTEPLSYTSAYPIKDAISPSQLGYKSNNKYEGFPPLMSDGRAITASYQPNAILNDYLLKEIGINSNWEYRQYLMKNGKEIMKYNCVQAANDSGYVKRYSDIMPSKFSTPYLYKSDSSMARPTGYKESDLKDLYISREQLESRMVAPEITQEQLLKMRT